MQNPKKTSFDIPTEIKQKIATDLLCWYDTAKRDLPWRRDKDPYRIWVSEIMLQQTRVETVIPYYERFIREFPDIYALAEALEDKVVKCWEGLGYYSRVRNLHTAVKEVATAYGGKVPDNPREFRTLPGVGDYTAGAVMSIAYDLPVAAVDGNVLRVFSRLVAIHEPVDMPLIKRGIAKLVKEMIPPGRAGDFNQALMELGALVCIPSNPRCDRCPIAQNCAGYQQGIAADLPNKRREKAPRKEMRVAGLLCQEDTFLIVQRPGTGLLAGLWEFPGCEVRNGETEPEALERLLLGWGLAVNGMEKFWDVSHTFSHIHWDVGVYFVQWSVKMQENIQPNRAWVTLEQMKDYAFPRVFKKIIERLQKSDI